MWNPASPGQRLCVADFLGVKLSWVREATRAERLPFVPLRRYRRYDPADIRAWVESQKARGSGPP